MLKPILYRAFCLVLLIIPAICISATQTVSPKPTLSGAFAFPGTNDLTIVRLSVNPGAIAKQAHSITEVLDKMTVVACAAGECQFAKPNQGLGFYEASFQLPTAAVTAKKFDLLVVTCSEFGCSQDKRTTTIVYPQDK